VKKILNSIGPGTLVAAAFIGPGTVTVCTLAGVRHGYELLWAMLFSILATICLQEMAARLGLITGKNLAEVIRQQIKKPALRLGAIVLIFSAILIGNAAYEAGNISGAVLGADTVFSDLTIKLFSKTISGWSLLIGGIAFVILLSANYKWIERILVGFVLLMSISFLIAALLTQPDIGSLIKGLFVPQFPKDSLLTIIGLVGTTIVPYNLFLHASLVQEKWSGVEALREVRWDLYISIALGGMVSLAIMICAGAIENAEINNAADLAQGLEPLYGSWAKYLLGIGLFCAGITSAITAPLAAAYVARGCFNWPTGQRYISFRITWVIILLIGIIFSSVGLKFIEIIRFAQIANGILLPIIAIFLVWSVNQKKLMGAFINVLWPNAVGITVIIITVILSLKTMLKIFGGI